MQNIQNGRISAFKSQDCFFINDDCGQTALRRAQETYRSVCLSPPPYAHTLRHTLTHIALFLYSSISPHLHKVKLCKHLQLLIYGPFKHVAVFLPHQTTQGGAVMEVSVDKALTTGVCVCMCVSECVHCKNPSHLPQSLLCLFFCLSFVSTWGDFQKTLR